MTDIVRLLNDFHIPYETNSKWANLQCPYCDDNGAHLGINISNPEKVYCFKCGGHSLLQTLNEILSLPSSQIKKLLKEYTGHSIIVKQLNEKKAQKVILPSSTSNPFSRGEEKYLLSRHFIPEELHKKNGVYGGGIIGEWAYRIILPFYEHGKLITFVGRAINSKLQPRYLNLPTEKSLASAKELLFNIQNAKSRIGIVTEGPMDALRLGDNAVSLQGVQYTKTQLKKLKTYFDKVFIMFDADEAGQSAARLLLLDLKSIGVKAEISNACQEYGKKDPGEFPPRIVEQIRKKYL